jgi:hypothetical protein
MSEQSMTVERIMHSEGTLTRRYITAALALIACATVAALAPSLARAAWSTAFVSSGQLGLKAETPATAVDADGDSFYVWRRSDNVIQGRARTAGRLGPLMTLSKVDIGLPAVEMPAVAANSRGDSLYAWLTTNPAKTNYLIQGRYRTAAGTLGPLQTLVSEPVIEGEIIEVDVSLDADGDGVVMYQQESLNDGAIVLARQRSATGKMGVTKRISAGGIDSEVFDPEVEMDGGGEAVFVWQQDSPLGEGKIQARVLSPTGTLGRTETLVAADSSLSASEGEGEFTQLAVNPRGDAAFTWTRKIIATSKYVIEGRVLTDDNVLKRTVRVSSGDSEVTESEVDIANSGAAVFSWGQKDLVTGKFRFMGRQLSATHALGEAKTLTGGNNDVFHGHVGIDANGNAHFVWPDKAPITGLPLIRSRQITAAGALRPAATIAEREIGVEGSDLAVSARGDVVASWLNSDVNRLEAAFGP